MFKVPEKYRLKSCGAWSSDESFGNNGAFQVDKMKIIASDGDGWDHVSVSNKNKIPTWAQMCQVKNLFWDEEDCVIQFHPPKKEYVNFHEFTLHLWKFQGEEFKTPPGYMVGPK